MGGVLRSDGLRGLRAPAAFERAKRCSHRGWREGVVLEAGGRPASRHSSGTPVISIKTAQNLTGKSYRRPTAVGELAAAGILEAECEEPQERHSLVAGTSWRGLQRLVSAPLATISGDTAAEKPKKARPAKGRGRRLRKEIRRKDRVNFLNGRRSIPVLPNASQTQDALLRSFWPVGVAGTR